MEKKNLLQCSLPTLCFVDVADGVETCSHGNSYANEQEANFLVLLIQYLTLHGLEPENIGVITLYKAQLNMINSKLHEHG